jgi:hypothetical protein
VGKRTLAITFGVFVALLAIGQPFQVHKSPKKKVASAIETELASNNLTPPKFVFTSSQSGNALNFYMDAHPYIVRRPSWEAQPWTVEKRRPGDPVLIEVRRSTSGDDAAALNDVKIMHEFKHKSYAREFVYGYYEP